MKEPLKIGIAGLGTVGGGLLELFNTHGSWLGDIAGRPIVVTGVAAKSKDEQKGPVAQKAKFFADPVAMAKDPSIDAFVELMGGAMGVESEPGRGSTFRFDIVVTPLGSPEQPWLAPSPASLIGKSLLVVDDNETNRRILQAQAAGWGMKARVVGSGAEALALLGKGGAFDAAILDMSMPVMDGAMLAQEIRRRFPDLRMPLVLLSSLGTRDQVADGALFAAFLTKPAKPGQLVEALATLFKGDSLPLRVASAHPFPNPAVDAAAPTERVLLAEDNVVNQKVALSMLARLGLRADLAANGKEAIEALVRQRYDIVLMDVQMPELDGLAATRRIVERWPTRAHRPWIIAVTANAMLGDRETCLAAGMDDYITKPIRTQVLADAIARWRGKKHGDAVS